MPGFVDVASLQHGMQAQPWCSLRSEKSQETLRTDPFST